MSPEFWAIIGVGVAIVYLNYVAADENEKRLNKVIDELRRISGHLRPNDPDWDE